MNNTAKTIKHDTTIEILKSHGISPNKDTAVYNGEYVNNSSFYYEFGVKESYKYNDVMEWLGY